MIRLEVTIPVDEKHELQIRIPHDSEDIEKHVKRGIRKLHDIVDLDDDYQMGLVHVISGLEMMRRSKNLPLQPVFAKPRRD